MKGKRKVRGFLHSLVFFSLILVAVNVKAAIHDERVFFCNFETDICGFTQNDNDNFNWTRTSNQTPSAGTGPAEDHTKDGEYFMYIEASEARKQQEARLTSPSFAVTGKQLYVLKFFYHMNGRTIGHLNIYIQNLEGRHTVLWNETGHQGDLWYMANVIFYAEEDFQFVLEGIRGKRERSDIAIDDVSLFKSHYPLFCDFETWCNIVHQMSNDDDFNWRIHSGSTSTLLTGPEYDHTFLNKTGKYRYIEASPRDSGHTARLFSPHFADPNQEGISVNFTFYYHMYGSGTGSLNVYFATVESETLVWSINGSQANEWRFAEINIFTTQTHQLIIEGVVGTDYRGDIAIDDLHFDEYVIQETSSEQPTIHTLTTPQVGSTDGKVNITPGESLPGAGAVVIVGVVVAVVVLIGLVILIGVVLYKKRRKGSTMRHLEDRQVIVEGTTQQNVDFNVYDNVAHFNSDSDVPNDSVTKATAEPEQGTAFTNPIYANNKDDAVDDRQVVILKDDSKA
ncbi:MAM and LDL-receptor class A domain-containing protein 1-like [Glandiceps talaboti]